MGVEGVRVREEPCIFLNTASHGRACESVCGGCGGCVKE